MKLHFSVLFLVDLSEVFFRDSPGWMLLIITSVFPKSKLSNTHFNVLNFFKA